MELIYLGVGLLIGAAGAWLLLRNRYAGLSGGLASRDEQILRLTGELAVAETELKNLQQRLDERKSELAEMQERFRTEFRNLAQEIMEEKSRKFTEQNRTNLDQLLKPLGERIRDFEKKVTEVYDKEAQQRFSLKEEVRRLAELNQKIGEDAINLTRALKGDPKAQGNWGEMILESILEKSGLVKDREYFVQQSFRVDGKILRPDVIVRYPENRAVIIDSKVSLTAYQSYVAEEDPAGQSRYLKEHLASVRNHVLELSKTDYLGIYQLNSLDFIMLFLPVEPAYLLAIKEDPGLWTDAYERKILLISPTNLLAALKMIAGLWRQEYQNKNAIEIARQSGDLLDKFYALLEDLNDLGSRLKLTQKAYDDALNKLSEGKGNLIRRAQRIEELGAKARKKIPGNFDQGSAR